MPPRIKSRLSHKKRHSFKEPLTSETQKKKQKGTYFDFRLAEHLNYTHSYIEDRKVLRLRQRKMNNRLRQLIDKAHEDNCTFEQLFQRLEALMSLKEGKGLWACSYDEINTNRVSRAIGLYIRQQNYKFKSE